MAAEELEFTDEERGAAWALIDRAAAREASRERESLTAAAARACRAADCGCGEDAEDYLTRPLEEAHRCPNPAPRW
jgi:hypothetical protein